MGVTHVYSEETLATLRVKYHKLHTERNKYAERFGKQMSLELYAERYNKIFGEGKYPGNGAN